MRSSYYFEKVHNNLSVIRDRAASGRNVPALGSTTVESLGSTTVESALRVSTPIYRAKRDYMKRKHFPNKHPGLPYSKKGEHVLTFGVFHQMKMV